MPRHPFHHPARILLRQAADLIQGCQLVIRQADLGCPDILPELIGPLGANDDTGHSPLVQQPHRMKRDVEVQALTKK